MKPYQEINRETIDRWIEEGWEWGTPITHQQFANAQEGKWDVLLTPTVSVPHEWFGDLKGKKFSVLLRVVASRCRYLRHLVQSVRFWITRQSKFSPNDLLQTERAIPWQ